jgi:hypothetical protein
VLRHHHITDQRKVVTPTCLVENFYEKIALVCRAEQWETSVATARYEVQMAMPVTAFERVLQWDTVKLRTLCRIRKECGTRKFQCTTNGEFQLALRTAVVSSGVGRRQAARMCRERKRDGKGGPPATLSWTSPAPRTLTRTEILSLGAV